MYKEVENQELVEHIESNHNEVPSPESKKSQLDNNEEEAFQQLRSLSVSEEKKMDVDIEKIRKREGNVKPVEKVNIEVPNNMRHDYDPRIRDLPDLVKPLVQEVQDMEKLKCVTMVKSVCP